jgi:polyisoprenoid-binding protein YceI
MNYYQLPILFISFCTSAQAAIHVVESGKISFDAIGKPAFIHIEGTGTDITGEATVKATKVIAKYIFSLDSLDTGIELRNEHMKAKYLKTGEPERAKATLEIDNLSEFKGEATESRGELEGRLTLAGVTKPVKGSYEIQPDAANLAEKLKANAKFKIKLSDFKIDIPSFAGITVADEVQLNIDIVHKVKK